MNNYWNTNYKANQDGIAEFDFFILPHKKFSQTDAQRFGVEMNQPMIVVYK